VKIIFLANQDYASHAAVKLLTSALRSHHCLILFSPQVGATKRALDSDLAALARFDQDKLLSDLRLDAGVSGKDLAERLSRYYQVPVSLVSSVNNGKALQLIQAFQPDLMLSIRFGFILKAPVIAIPRYGVVNLHSGLLPEYRGVMATFWAMLHGCRTYGTTLHYIVDSRIDSGPIIERLEYPLDLKRTYLDNLLSLYKPGIAGMIQAVKVSDNGEIPSVHKADGAGSYYSMPKDTDVQHFLALGLRLYDMG
jgi:methionyl-tRNA formyltransferase